MAKHLHILDLSSISNLQDGRFRLCFPSQTLDLDKMVVKGIILWMRANANNGGYYSLELGSYVFDADRPSGNHHAKHKERLKSRLGIFNTWFDVHANITTDNNKHHLGGIVFFTTDPSVRVCREKDGDYVLQHSTFIDYVLGKLD